MSVRNLGGWATYYSEPCESIPIDDLRPHISGEKCWCKPENFQVACSDGGMWMHNALDQRERYENGAPLH